MITFEAEDCNTFSQISYDSMLDSVQLHQVKCTCGKTGCLIRYGHYSRKIRVLSEFVTLSIQRVKCKGCGDTHAIIPSSFVPYSQILLKEQQEILISAEKGLPPKQVMENNLLIDENNIKHIVRQFLKHWKQRILSIGISLADRLAIPCLSVYGRQFMQVHRTQNIYYAPPT